MIIAGQADTHVPVPMVAQLLDALARQPPAPWFVDLPTAGHWIYIDFCPTGDPNCGPDRLPEAQGQAYVKRWAAAFLLRSVAGDARYVALLDPAHAGDPSEIRVERRRLGAAARP